MKFKISKSTLGSLKVFFNGLGGDPLFRVLLFVHDYETSTGGSSARNSHLA